MKLGQTRSSRLIAHAAGVATAIAMMSFSTPAHAQARKITKEALDKIVPGLGTRIFKPTERHPIVPAIRLKNEKFLYILVLKDEKNSRCTYDFDSHKDKGEGWYRCYIDTTASARLRAQLQLVRKGDKTATDNVTGGDATRNIQPGGPRGEAIGHERKIYLEGGRNYFAERGLDVKQILDKDDSAALIFYPDGMTVDEALGMIGDQ